MLVSMLEALTRLFRRAPAADEPNWVEVPALRRRLAGAAPPLIVDVRGADEFHGPLGHIEGARNIPLDELMVHRGELLAAGRPVVFVCLTHKRSADAAAQLAAAGLHDVGVLRGGMKAWRED